jgi:hypothetical protein
MFLFICGFYEMPVWLEVNDAGRLSTTVCQTANLEKLSIDFVIGWTSNFHHRQMPASDRIFPFSSDSLLCPFVTLTGTVEFIALNKAFSVGGK